MTRNEVKPSVAAVQELFAQRAEGLREIVRAVMQEMLEADMAQYNICAWIDAICNGGAQSFLYVNR